MPRRRWLTPAQTGDGVKRAIARHDQRHQRNLFSRNDDNSYIVAGKKNVCDKRRQGAFSAEIKIYDPKDFENSSRVRHPGLLTKKRGFDCRLAR